MNEDVVHNWHRWANNHLMHDIRSNNKMSPVPLFDEGGWEHGASDQFNQLHLDLPQEPSYVYILYLDDNPADAKWQVENIRPVYIGQTSKKSDSTYTGDGHINKLQKTKNPNKEDAAPKYQHIVNICNISDSRLYSWTRPISEIEEGPYGYSCSAVELEGKICGLLHQIQSFRRTLANREDYIPNWSKYRRNLEHIDWVQLDQLPDADPDCWNSLKHRSNKSKENLWTDWIDEYLMSDIKKDDRDDPIPLFETEPEKLTVSITSDWELKRYTNIEAKIQHKGEECISNGEPISCEREGLIYIMYYLDGDSNKIDISDIQPLYIGKAGVWGKESKLSKNFENIKENQNRKVANLKTGQFARWGDNTYYHIGDLSKAVKDGSGKRNYLWWAQKLFEPKSRCLNQEVYLWVDTWDRSEDQGPYQTTPPLPAVESQLIALAYEISSETLLNNEGVPYDARIKQGDPKFESQSEQTRISDYD